MKALVEFLESVGVLIYLMLMYSSDINVLQCDILWYIIVNVYVNKLLHLSKISAILKIKSFDTKYKTSTLT